MVIGFKDAFKLVGVSVIFFCAAFVCTFFLSYYMDVITLRDEVPAELSVLYNAQVSMAQFTSAITGGVLVLIAAVMLVFYVKLYVDSHAKQLGVLKALGFSNARLAASFCLFGLSARFRFRLRSRALHLREYVYRGFARNRGDISLRTFARYSVRADRFIFAYCVLLCVV